MTVATDTPPAARILARMEEYVLQSTSEFNKTPTPECSYKQKIAEITARLNQSTARLPEPLSRPGDENTINDIVQYASEIKALEKADFENAYNDATKPQLTRIRYLHSQWSPATTSKDSMAMMSLY